MISLPPPPEPPLLEIKQNSKSKWGILEEKSDDLLNEENERLNSNQTDEKKEKKTKSERQLMKAGKRKNVVNFFMQIKL